MHSFEYEGVTITLKQPTGRDRVHLERLRNLAGYYEMSKTDREETEAVLNLLYLTTKVDGDLGFPVPCNGNVTAESLRVFIDGILDAPETLFLRWNNTRWDAVTDVTGDPDLAPPEVVEKKDSKTQPSDENAKPSKKS